MRNINTKLGLVANLSAVLLTACIGVYGLLRTSAGELVPSEFGVDGEPIAFGSRGSVFFTPVLIVLGLGLVFVAIPQLDRKGTGFARNNRGYLVIWVGALSLAVFMFATFAHAAVSGSADSDGRPFIGLVGAIVAAIGFFVPRTFYGYILGLRTKWTMSDRGVWTKTHLLVGRMLVVLGIAVIVCSIVATRDGAVGLLIAGLGVTWLAGAVYATSLGKRASKDT